MGDCYRCCDGDRGFVTCGDVDALYGLCDLVWCRILLAVRHSGPELADQLDESGPHLVQDAFQGGGVHRPVQPEHLPVGVLAHEHGKFGSHGRGDPHAVAWLSGDQRLNLADALPEPDPVAQAVAGEVGQVEELTGCSRNLNLAVRPSITRGAGILR